jgi:hypothetical protein
MPRLIATLGARAASAAAGLAFAGFVASAHAQDPQANVSPRPLAGPYPIACSNVAQDFGRLPPGESVELTWEGYPRSDGSQRYATDLLSDPANTLIARFTAPDDRELFGPWRGQTLTYVVLVCYPTTASNDRPDYLLPNGKRVPRMQRGGEPPILPDATGRWPLLVFSHGYGGSPLSNDYIDALAVFASWGYVVAAPFHGDPRYAVLDFGEVSGIVDSIVNFERYTAMQSTRPLSGSAALDLVLSHPQWSDRIDPARIGGFGASQGGETMMLMGGAELTKSISLSTRRVTRDERLKAAVGYVPYFGALILPAFGRDNRGVEGVTLPFLAISGTADVVAPIGPVRDGIRRLPGSRTLVRLEGTTHGFDELAAGDIFTWSLDWLDALVKDDRTARARVQRMQRVAGGRVDVRELDYVAPAPASGDERTVVEFYNPSLDHYFITAEAAEVEALDAGVIVPGWQRTGRAFKAWVRDAGPGAAACRYFGTPGVGPNTHFYSVYPHECALLAVDPKWMPEGIAFRAEPISAGAICPPGRSLVWRLYNNGKGGQANHRYLTSGSDIDRMVGEGWGVEGPAFCTPP